MHEIIENNKLLGVIGSVIFAMLLLLGLTFKYMQSENELKGKLLLGGVTANSVMCTINNSTAACLAAALEDVKVAKEIRFSPALPKPTSTTNATATAQTPVYTTDNSIPNFEP